MGNLRWVAIFSIFLGVGLLFGARVMGLAVNDTYPPEIREIYPYGTEASPAYVVPGSQLNLRVDAFDSISGISLVKAEVFSGYEHITTLMFDLSMYPDMYVARWTVPIPSGVRYELMYEVHDYNYNVAKQTVYIVAAQAPIPTGTIFVNEEVMTQLDTFTVTSPVLHIQYSPGNAKDQATGVYFTISKGGAQIYGTAFNTMNGGTIDYTLTGSGTYRIHCDIEYKDATGTVKYSPICDVMITYGGGGINLGGNWTSTVGYAALGFGAILMVADWRKSKN